MAVKGLKELSRGLNKLSSKMKELDGEHSVSMSELLNPQFISKHTRFKDADELFAASGFEFESEDDFKAIPQEALDAFIGKESSFENWQAMIQEAGGEWVKKQLSF